MPTVTKRATVVGNVVSTWTNTPNAVDAGTATFAQWAVTTANATGSLDLSGFDFSALPDDAIISSVSIRVKGYVSNTTRMLAPTAALFVGGVQRGTTDTLAPHVTTTTNIYTVLTETMTVAELKAGNFFVRFTARRAGVTQAANTNLDYIEIDVTYTRPEVVSAWNGTDWALPQFWNGTQWRADAEVWNGTRWIPIGES